MILTALQEEKEAVVTSTRNEKEARTASSARNEDRIMAATTAGELVTTNLDTSTKNGDPEFMMGDEDKDTTPPLKDLTKRIPAARRKPEKSRIVRVWQNDDSKDLTCPNCFSELLSEADLERHISTCRGRSLSPRNHLGESDPFFRYRNDSSPEPSDTSSVKENSPFISDNTQEPTSSSTGYTQVLKMLRQAVPQMNNSQQLALEVILNAQMSLSRMSSYNGRGDERGDSPEGTSNAISLQQQQLLQLQLIQLLQAQLTVNGEKNPEIEDSHKNGKDFDKVPEDFPKFSLGSEGGRRAPTPTNKLNSPNNLTPRNNLSNSRKLFQDDTPDNTGSPSLGPNKLSSQVIQHPDSPPSGIPNTLEMLQKTADEVLNNASKGLLASRLIDSCREADAGDPSRRHRCRYCGKVFSSDSGLQIHIRSHTGERPFKCNVCGNRFTTKGNLKVHFQRHQDQFPNVKMNPHPVPEHLDKFYPPILPPNSDSMCDGSNMPPTSPPSVPTSSNSSSIPPFKPISLRPPPPLNLNFKNPAESFLKPPTSSESLNKELTRNFLDFRLFPPFLVPPPSLRKSIDEEMSEHKETSQSPEKIKEPQSLSENNELMFNSDNIKKEDERSLSPAESLMNGSYHENLKSVKKLLTSNNIHNHALDSLNLLRRDFMGPSLSEPRNLYKDVINFKENSEFAEDFNSDAPHQPLNLKARSQLEKEVPMEDTDQNDEELKNDRDEQDPYMSDSSTGTGTGGDKGSKLSSPSGGSPMEFSHIPFLGMPMPQNLALLHGLHFPFQGPPPNSQAFHPTSLDPSKMPQIYNNLLPRPGSTDNSWEALIEVNKCDENEKIEQLIDKNKDKPTEPNQCAICQRVLSCKSALQMHYRIHTGERPFKCKICSRSFTTKGNLKTHMSVHRAKPPMRMLQQCPICHKKFANALILQQHIRLHTGEPTDLSPEQIYAAEVRDFPLDLPMPMRFPHLGPGGLPPHMQPRGPFPPQHLHLPLYHSQKPPRKEEIEGKYGSPFSSSPRSSSTSSAEQHSAEDLSMRMREDENANNEALLNRGLAVSPTLSDYSDIDDKSPDKDPIDSRESPSKEHHHPTITTGDSSLYNNFGESHMHPMGFRFPPGVGFSSPNKDPSSMKPTMFPFFPPLGLFSPTRPTGIPMQGLGIPGISALPEGNTTCKVCFKIFACQSALEIHLRSHTKERPFKCSFCDRGFSTKGNMKQHLATHKLKDGCSDDENKMNSSSPHSAAENYTDTSSGMEGSPDKSPSRELPPSGCLESGVTPLAGMSSLTKDEEEERNDSGTKREREGELSLPDPKRSTGLPDNQDISTNETRHIDRGVIRSPIDLPPTYFHTSINPPTTIPFPASMSIPSSLHGINSMPFVSRNSIHPMALPLSLSLSFPSPLTAPKSDSLEG